MGKCRSWRIPKCKTKCVKSINERYKLYETRTYSLYKECSCCGCEFNFRQYPACPRCGGFKNNFYNEPLRGIPSMEFWRDGNVDRFGECRPEFDRGYFAEDPCCSFAPEFKW